MSARTAAARSEGEEKMRIRDLLALAKAREDCAVQPPSGLPAALDEAHPLPKEIEEFYTLCGGLELFIGSERFLRIVPPQEFAAANPVICGEQYPEDRSAHWYIIGEDDNGQYITIDLFPERQGRCYDSFWDRHGLAGDCPILAGSFSQLLARLLEEKADWYWLREDFQPLGDAYDDLPGLAE